MKFDIIVGNPPYQAPQVIKNDKGISGGGTTLWDKFVIKGVEFLKQNGHLCLVHPAGWRGLGKNTLEAKTALMNKGSFEYLEIHNVDDGQKTFGATTRYDWYVWQKSKLDRNTTIKDECGNINQVNISKMPFIPNGMYEEIQTLIAKEGEETCEVLYNRSSYGSDKSHVSKNQTKKEETCEVLHSYSAYESRKDWISKNKTDTFKYPCVYYVDKHGNPTLWYSSINTNGHFNVPKVIFASGVIKSVGFIADTSGKYGLTQFAKAIVDTPTNIPLITKAMNTSKFRKIMEMCVVGQTEINKDVLATFRKDFWKEFVDENGKEI